MKQRIQSQPLRERFTKGQSVRRQHELNDYGPVSRASCELKRHLLTQKVAMKDARKKKSAS
jgi:hypothetical protein